MVLALPDVPPAPGRPARRPAPPARRRPVLRPLPARRPDGGGRRLPGRAPRGRAGAAPPGRVGPAGHGPLVHPDGRVPGVGRDHDPRPPAGPRPAPPPSAGPWRWATCPTCSATWPRCPSCCASSASTTPWCGAGVPEAMTTTAFWWEAPDGSVVRAQYLPDGYSNGAALPDDAKDLVAQIRGLRADLRLPGRRRRRRPAAVDERHRPPDAPALARAGGGRGQRPPGRLRLRVGSLAGYLAEATTGTASTTSRGELRSGARANLLMGVASNRVDVHQASAAGRARPGAAGRAAQRPVARRPALARRPCSTRPGWP